MQWSFAIPVVEDAGRVILLLHRFTMVSGRQRAVLLPCASGHLKPAAAVSRDLQKTQGRRLLCSALRQGKLPPQTFDTCGAALALDRLAKLLADDLDLGVGCRSVVTHGGEAEEIGWKLRAAGMQDEGPPHAEESAQTAR